MKKILGVFSVCLFMFSVGCKSSTSSNSSINTNTESDAKVKSASQEKSYLVTSSGIKIDKVIITEEKWKSKLTPTQFYILREKGTERAFTGDLLSNKEEGIYTCAACNMPLFESGTKFKSGTGWPSYYQPIEKEFIKEDTDHILGYARTEVMCNRCNGHLGHVFNDGPAPTGLRYCINSVSMNFEKGKSSEALIKSLIK